jgi:hypothetical protein
MLLAELALGLDGRGRPYPHGDFWKEKKTPPKPSLDGAPNFTLVGQVLSNPCGLAKS